MTSDIEGKLGYVGSWKLSEGVSQGWGSPMSNSADRLSKVMTETWSLDFVTRGILTIVSGEGKT